MFSSCWEDVVCLLAWSMLPAAGVHACHTKLVKLLLSLLFIPWVQAPEHPSQPRPAVSISANQDRAARSGHYSLFRGEGLTPAGRHWQPFGAWLWPPPA